MDYESEEEGVDDAEEKEHSGEEELEENSETKTVEESEAESSGLRMQKEKKLKKKEAEEESFIQMRVNSVLEINSAIERYSFDQQEELWCEVSCCVSFLFVCF